MKKLFAKRSDLSPGSTNMIAGLERVYELAQNNFDENKLSARFFGDGNAMLGIHLEEFNSLTRMNGQEGIYLSGVGVGTNYDWERMDQLTDAGKGAHVFCQTVRRSISFSELLYEAR